MRTSIIHQPWCVNVNKQLTNILICFRDAPGHLQIKAAQDVTNLHHSNTLYV